MGEEEGESWGDGAYTYSFFGRRGKFSEESNSLFDDNLYLREFNKVDFSSPGNLASNPLLEQCKNDITYKYEVFVYLFIIYFIIFYFINSGLYLYLKYMNIFVSISVFICIKCCPYYSNQNISKLIKYKQNITQQILKMQAFSHFTILKNGITL